MKLHEIIDCNDNLDLVLSYETLHPYLKSLYAYYKDYFCCEPILMITDVMNAVQYCKIVSSNDFDESVRDWIERDAPELTEEDKECEYELIAFQSSFLSDCINI